MAVAAWCLPDSEVKCLPGGFTVADAIPEPPAEAVVAPPPPAP
jgi:hypothetical protein